MSRQRTPNRGGTALAERLRRLGLSHAAAGKAIGKRPSTVSMYVSGRAVPPNTPEEPIQNRIKALWGVEQSWWGEPAEQRSGEAA